VVSCLVPRQGDVSGRGNARVPVDPAKSAARRCIRGAIAGIDPGERLRREKRIRGRLFSLPEFRRARRLMLYVTMTGEIDTRPIIVRVIQAGRAAYAPRCDETSKQMKPCRIPSLADLRPGAYGILEPPDGPQPEPADIDFVLVPGLGFDVLGNRLGRGAGFYDRFLADPGMQAVRCAIAFECQILDDLPHGSNDLPVHVIVTEERIIRCRPRPE